MVLTDTLANILWLRRQMQVLNTCDTIYHVATWATWLCTGITKQLTLAKFWWCRRHCYSVIRCWCWRKIMAAYSCRSASLFGCRKGDVVSRAFNTVMTGWQYKSMVCVLGMVVMYDRSDGLFTTWPLLPCNIAMSCGIIASAVVLANRRENRLIHTT